MHQGMPGSLGRSVSPDPQGPRGTCPPGCLNLMEGPSLSRPLKSAIHVLAALATLVAHLEMTSGPPPPPRAGQGASSCMASESTSHHPECVKPPAVALVVCNALGVTAVPHSEARGGEQKLSMMWPFGPALTVEKPPALTSCIPPPWYFAIGAAPLAFHIEFVGR